MTTAAGADTIRCAFAVGGEPVEHLPVTRVDTAAVGGRRRKLFRSGHAYEDIAALLDEVEPKGRCLDLPAGDGVNVEGIRKAGFEPVAADLFPEQAIAKGVACARVDFTEPLPFADGSFAAVLCSEGIEHSCRQLDLIRELARVLQPGGSLLITTPNMLNLRARLSFLLSGHRSLKGGPIGELSQSPGASPDGRVYIGHVFLVPYFALRFMLKAAGFDRIRVATAKYSPTSLLLAPLLWLPVRLTTGRLLRRLRAEGYGDMADEMLAHVMSADLLFGKKLILLAQRPCA